MITPVGPKKEGRLSKYKTQTEDVDLLLEALESARKQCATFADGINEN